MKKTVEYYRLWDNHTWDTEVLTIEARPGDDLEKRVREVAQRIKWRDGQAPVAVGLYYVPEDEEVE